VNSGTLTRLDWEFSRQKIVNRDNGNTRVRAQVKQMMIATDNVSSLSSLCAPEKGIIIWISVDNWVACRNLEDGCQVHGVADQIRRGETDLVKPRPELVVR